MARQRDRCGLSRQWPALCRNRNFHARRIANSTRGQIVWQVSPRVTLTGRYEHLAAGPALTMAGYKSSDYMSGWASLRF
jgi:hypothetical protein